ncbi:MAG: hypothetical protein ACRDPY_46940 [Streptosporangiaceae bacterium]
MNPPEPVPTGKSVTDEMTAEMEGLALRERNAEDKGGLIERVTIGGSNRREVAAKPDYMQVPRRGEFG